MGGSGATLALVVGMLLFARSQQLKSLGRLSIAPGIFNINEMVTFGMPIVMNPLLLIPFILVPVVLTIVSYFAMEWGWVARPSGAAVPWTTPILFSGYLGSGGKISGVILQLVNFALAFFIYLPFLKIWDKQNWRKKRGVKNYNGYDRDESFSFNLAWGNARSCSMEAIDCAKRGEFTEAEAKLQEALEELKEAPRTNGAYPERGWWRKDRSYSFNGTRARPFNECNYGERISE